MALFNVNCNVNCTLTVTLTVCCYGKRSPCDREGGRATGPVMPRRWCVHVYPNSCHQHLSWSWTRCTLASSSKQGLHQSTNLSERRCARQQNARLGPSTALRCWRRRHCQRRQRRPVARARPCKDRARPLLLWFLPLWGRANMLTRARMCSAAPPTDDAAAMIIIMICTDR